ncbi:MAG: hypothetical protein JO241_09830 [Candidatus Eremiobacteraeota bacterium]|nr:hypothetical protein [Candidatus Eremiobacteraeota bacterium]
MISAIRLSLVATLLLLASGCGAPAAVPPAPASTVVDACAAAGRYVSVGGTAGFNTLVRADFTTALRATGRVRLYEHGSAVSAAISDSPSSKPYAILDAIQDVFNDAGPGEAELGLVGANYFTLPPTKAYGDYQYEYVASGLKPDAANVNVPYGTAASWHFSRANVRAWTEWVRAGRSVGIKTMAPVVAPNVAWVAHDPAFPPTRQAYYDWNSDYYKLSRFEALYGGAIAFDTPSDFFLSGGSGAGYQGFIEQAIRWADGHGLRATVLVSWYATRRVFSASTEKYVRVLTRRAAVPTEWAVDDYENTNANDAAAMGPETVANTSTQVALWLATHAPAYVHGRICYP